jgi:hypothetical protein
MSCETADTNKGPSAGLNPGVAVTADGGFLIADPLNHVVRKVASI